MQLTRKQIIDYLASNHTATAIELSRVINVTAANIRHHLSELAKQKIVEVVGSKKPKGRGRPTKLYCLSKGAHHHNLDFLASILLKSGLEERHFNQKVASKMMEEFNPPIHQIKRLNQAIEWLNKHSYQSRWEASPNGPRIILGYCPYVAILDSNPEMCQIDTELVSQLSGTKMEQLTKLEHSPHGNRQCVFITSQT